MDAHGWQPMATAPKDGTDVLVYSDCVTIANWIAKDGFWSDFTISDGYTADDQHCPCEPAPTHWMPLPPPPETNEKADDDQ